MYEKFKLYNKDIKIGFAKNYSTNADTQQMVLYDFQRISVLEKKLDKDLALFNYEDISEVLKYLLASSEASIKRTLSVFAMYRDWYVGKDVHRYGIGLNYFKLYSKYENIKEFVPTDKIDNMYISEEELQIILTRLVNAQDKALLLALYEGVKGAEMHELRHLSIKDINTERNTLKLINKGGSIRTIGVTKQLVDMLIQANKQDFIVKNNGVQTPGMKSLLRPLACSIYIFKVGVSSKNQGKDEPMMLSTLNTAIRRIRGYEGGEFEFITPSSIYTSGMINKVIFEYKQGFIEDINTDTIAKVMNNYELNYNQVYNVLQKIKLVIGIKY